MALRIHSPLSRGQSLKGRLRPAEAGGFVLPCRVTVCAEKSGSDSVLLTVTPPAAFPAQTGRFYKGKSKAKSAKNNPTFASVSTRRPDEPSKFLPLLQTAGATVREDLSEPLFVPAGRKAAHSNLCGRRTAGTRQAVSQPTPTPQAPTPRSGPGIQGPSALGRSRAAPWPSETPHRRGGPAGRHRRRHPPCVALPTRSIPSTYCSTVLDIRPSVLNNLR